MMRPICSTVVATLLACATGTGQYLAKPLGWHRDFPTTLIGAVRSPAIGDFDDDAFEDLAFVDDGTGEIILGWCIAGYPYYVETGVTGVDAIATLRVPNAPDGLVAVGAGGARIVAYAPDQTAFVTTAIPGWNTVDRVFTLQQGQVFLIAGIDATGDVIRCGTWNPTNGFTQQAVISDPDILDVALADWDNAMPLLPEVVVRTQNALRVYSPVTGSLLYTEAKASSVANGSITRVVASGQDHIAWLRLGATGKWRLHLYTAGAQVQSFPFNLQPLELQSAELINIAAGDYNGDQNDDLAYFEVTSQFRVVFPFDPAIPGYDLSNYYIIQDGFLSSGVDTEPLLFADINHDKNSRNPQPADNLADLVIVHQSLGHFALHVDLDSAFPDAFLYPEEVIQAPAGPLLDEEDYPVINNGNQFVEYYDPNDPNAMVLKLLKPNVYPWATHCQVVWWHLLVPVQGGSPSQMLTLEDHDYMTLPENPGAFDFLLHIDNPSTVPTSTLSYYKEDQYFLQICFYQLNANGETIQNSPPFVWGMASDEDEDWETVYDHYMGTIATGAAGSGEYGIQTKKVGANRTIGIMKIRDLPPPPSTTENLPVLPLSGG